MLQTRPKPCKHCASPLHQSFQCGLNKKPLITTKPLAKVGKQGKRTQAAVTAWKATVEPNHQGLYQCHYCPALVPYLMAEHMDSKTRVPGRRTDLTNFVAVCAKDNKAKGSLNHDDYPHTCH